MDSALSLVFNPSLGHNLSILALSASRPLSFTALYGLGIISCKDGFVLGAFFEDSFFVRVVALAFLRTFHAEALVCISKFLWRSN